MKYIYKNNFLKQIRLLWILVATILMILINTVINISFEKIKSNYINERCALVGSISNVKVFQEDKLTDVFKQDVKYEDYQKGKQILASYGYNEEMDIKLIPTVNE